MDNEAKDKQLLEISFIKKELYISKVMAKFSHYCSGNLYYTVQLSDGVYLFPIETIEKSESFDSEGSVKLSFDLGTTEFGSEMKASELIRWIRIAFEKDEFIKVG